MPLLSPAEAAEAVHDRSNRVSALVCGAWDRLAAPTLPETALLAVGGFGRAELFPCSDVDLLILVGDETMVKPCREPIGAFTQALWDCKLRVSHSVRTVAECVELHEGNAELSVSLLDRRFLAGNVAQWFAVEAKWPTFVRVHGAELARRIGRLARERHAKYHNTIYHLEPNIKETPGGLRDVALVEWIAGLLAHEVPLCIADSKALLHPIRVFLHERAGRDHNSLDFDAQEALAEDPAGMMRSYYRCARETHSAALRTIEATEQRGPSLLSQFRDWRSRLSNSDFTVSRDRVFLRSPGALAVDPDLPVRAFAFLARHGLELAPDSEARLAAHFRERRDRSPNWMAWQSILRQSHASAGLRAAQKTGALQAWLPEWRHIDSLVVRDFYHRYTVDEHTLVAIESLEDIGDDRFRELFNEIDRPDLLRLALLLHDIGKGTGNHVVVSQVMAREILKRVEAPEADAEVVLFLIAEHLALSNVMTARDLADPSTAVLLAERVGTMERLKLLALLTWADIGAVHPGALTPWRTEQLWRTYLAGYEELTRELATQRIHALDGASPEVAAFVEGFPTRYQRTHTRAEMVAHLELSRAAARAGAAVEIERLNGFFRATIAGPDHRGLFAALSGALAAFGMNILKAEAFSNAAGQILDVFIFADPHRTLELNPDETERLRHTLVRAAVGKEDIRRLLQRRPPYKPRPGRPDPRVLFDASTPTATRVEIVAEDRPGLLYDLSAALSVTGCDIDVVLIDTEGAKAIDVFYVSSNGRALDSGQRDRLRTALLAACSPDEKTANRTGQSAQS